MRETQLPISVDTDKTIKTLGIKWSPASDQFFFKVCDPLGWLGPITIHVKILFQRMWLTTVGWDEAVPQDVATHWRNYCDDLPNISQLHVDRCNVIQNAISYDLIGFCDSSELLSLHIFSYKKLEQRLLGKAYRSENQGRSCQTALFTKFGTLWSSSVGKTDGCCSRRAQDHCQGLHTVH